jgi:hypothetical protein
VLAGVAMALTAAVLVGSTVDRPRSNQASPATDPPLTTVVAPASTVAAKPAAKSSDLLADPSQEWWCR